jgi:hypothetical protein
MDVKDGFITSKCLSSANSILKPTHFFAHFGRYIEDTRKSSLQVRIDKEPACN